MFGEQERADAQIHHGQAHVEALPQRDRPVLRAVQQRAGERAHREAREHEAGVLFHVRFGGERDDRDAGGRLECAQTEPRDAHRDEARAPDRVLLAAHRAVVGLARGLLHGRIIEPFGLGAHARVVRGALRAHEPRLLVFARTELLARQAGLARKLRLARRACGELGEEHQRADEHAQARHGEREHTGDDGERGGERIAHDPHRLVEHARKRQRAVDALPVVAHQVRPARAAHRAPRRHGGEERHDAVQHGRVGVGEHARDERCGGDHPHDDCRDGDGALPEAVDERAQHGAQHGAGDRLHGGQRAGERVITVVLLRHDRHRHADHRERHARDDRSDGKTRGVWNTEKFGVPAEDAMDDVVDAVGVIGGHGVPLLSAHGFTHG